MVQIEGIRSLNRERKELLVAYIKIVLYPNRREIERDPPRFAFVPALASPPACNAVSRA